MAASDNASATTEQEALAITPAEYKFVVEAFLMPGVSSFGLVGNLLSIYILRRREVKLKPEFVEVLCSLATFDNLLLVCTFLLFTLPAVSDAYAGQVFPYTIPYLYPVTNIFMTCSIYMTAAVAVNRYLDLTDFERRLRSGYVQVGVTVLSLSHNSTRTRQFWN